MIFLGHISYNVPACLLAQLALAPAEDKGGLNGP